MFRRTGRVPEPAYDLFHPPSWVAVLLGQGIVPAAFDPMVEAVPEREAEQVLDRVRSLIAQTAQAMPTQQQFINRHCRAESVELRATTAAAVSGR